MFCSQNITDFFFLNVNVCSIQNVTVMLIKLVVSVRSLSSEASLDYPIGQAIIKYIKGSVISINLVPKINST